MARFRKRELSLFQYAFKLALNVDTLFDSKYFSDYFCSYGNSEKTCVIKWFIVFQHAVDGMQQFTHDSTDCL